MHSESEIGHEIITLVASFGPQAVGLAYVRSGRLFLKFRNTSHPFIVSSYDLRVRNMRMTRSPLSLWIWRTNRGERCNRSVCFEL